MWPKEDVLAPAQLVVRPERGWGTGPSERSGQVGSSTAQRLRGDPELSRQSLLRSGRCWRLRLDRQSREPGRAARDALPSCAFRLKGDPDLPHNNNKTSALAPGASASSPRPPATCRRLGRARPCAALPCPAQGGQAESGPRPLANFSGGQRAASRDPGPGRGRRRRRAAGRERPPRRTPGRTVRPAALPGRGGRRWRAPRPSFRYPCPGGSP